MTKKRKTVEVAPEVKELFARVLLKLKPTAETDGQRVGG